MTTSSGATTPATDRTDVCLLRCARAGLTLPALSLLVACVSVRVEPLTHQSYPARSHQEPIEALQAEPFRPHVKLARIIATSQNASEETLRGRILGRARALGADAVVLGRADVIETLGSGPAYQSTMGPGGAGITGSGMAPSTLGWWTPFYLDPWSFVQGSSDQPGLILYLSGVAIRYREEQGRVDDSR